MQYVLRLAMDVLLWIRVFGLLLSWKFVSFLCTYLGYYNVPNADINQCK